MDIKEKSLALHKALKGKVEMISRATLNSKEDLALLYSPGVAEPCLEIEKNEALSYTYTRRHNTIAVISDGSAVLGLGNIGPLASMPVMEGKAILFKTLGDVDAIPIILNTQDTLEIIKTIEIIAPSFGGINIEDISAPRCFEIETALKKSLNIPVFHDDQHGTAIVVGAALINALKLVEKRIDKIKVVINGAGAAGQAIAHYLLSMGVTDMIVCDKFGILSKDDRSLSHAHLELAKRTNVKMQKGLLLDATKDADVLIGVSAKHAFHPSMISHMSRQPIVFAMANPTPEIEPDSAYEAGAYIVGTGSSKYNNQINNLLAFPGIFRGTLDAHAKEISYEMMKAASYAIASYVREDLLTKDFIIPNPLDKDVHRFVAQAVKHMALKQGISKTHT